MSSIGWFALDSCVWLLAAMIATALLIGAVAGTWALLAAGIERLITRDCRELDDGLPGHRTGRLHASRGHRRRLHRDLVLLLVVNTNRADEADAP